MMQKLVSLVGAMVLCGTVAMADEIVYRTDPGLLVNLRRNIRIADTVKVGTISYVHYYAKEGEVQVPVENVVEVRLNPYDIAKASIITIIPDTVAIPIPRPTPVVAKKSVTVSSIAALKTNLLDNTVDEIIITNGTYSVTPGRSGTTSLFINNTYASRTRPITVRAQTRGAVIFDGGGGTGECMQFLGGAHDMTWDGISMTRYNPASTGVILIGGWIDTPTNALGVYNLTFRYINIYNCTGRAKVLYDPALDHAIYISYAKGGNHDMLFDNISVDDRNRGGIATAFHYYHSDPANGILNAYNVTMSNITVRGTYQGFIIADATLKNILVTDATVENALDFGVDYEGGNPVTLRNITTTGSGVKGFNSTLGSNPAGLTIVNCSFN